MQSIVYIVCVWLHWCSILFSPRDVQWQCVCDVCIYVSANFNSDIIYTVYICTCIYIYIYTYMYVGSQSKVTYTTYKFCMYTSTHSVIHINTACTQGYTLLSCMWSCPLRVFSCSCSPSSCPWMDSSWSKGESSLQHISTRIREGDNASCTQLTFYVAAPSGLSIQLQISNTYINAYVRILTHAIPDNATLYALHL